MIVRSVIGCPGQVLRGAVALVGGCLMAVVGGCVAL